MSDWKQEREKVLAEARCLVIKMGSAVLTGPDGLDSSVLDDLAYQMTLILTKSLFALTSLLKKLALSRKYCFAFALV